MLTMCVSMHFPPLWAGLVAASITAQVFPPVPCKVLLSMGGPAARGPGNQFGGGGGGAAESLILPCSVRVLCCSDCFPFVQGRKRLPPRSAAEPPASKARPGAAQSRPLVRVCERCGCTSQDIVLHVASTL